MPTYEYECEKCQKTFELFQSMKAEPLVVCPKEHCCQATWGEGKVRRLIGTGAGLLFKGSGFYITDYRSSGYQDAARKDATPSAPAKSESTPAAPAAKPAEAPKPAKSSE